MTVTINTPGAITPANVQSYGSSGALCEADGTVTGNNYLLGIWARAIAGNGTPMSNADILRGVFVGVAYSWRATLIPDALCAAEGKPDVYNTLHVLAVWQEGYEPAPIFDPASVTFKGICHSCPGFRDVRTAVTPDDVLDGWYRYSVLSVNDPGLGNRLKLPFRASRILVAADEVSWGFAISAQQWRAVRSPLGDGSGCVGVDAPFCNSIWRFPGCPQRAIVIHQPPSSPFALDGVTYVVAGTSRSQPVSIPIDPDRDVYAQVNSRVTDFVMQRGSFGLWIHPRLELPADLDEGPGPQAAD